MRIKLAFALFLLRHQPSCLEQKNRVEFLPSPQNTTGNVPGSIKRINWI